MSSMSATREAEYEDASASWEEACEEQAADPRAVCDYDYYDENAEEWEEDEEEEEEEGADDYYYRGGYDAYGHASAWQHQAAGKGRFSQVPTSAIPCRNGKFCSFFAKGICKYLHAEQDLASSKDASAAQSASAQISKICAPQAKRLQTDLRDLRNQLQALTHQERLQTDLRDLRNQLQALTGQIPTRNETAAASSSAPPQREKKQAQPRNNSSGRPPIVIDLSESRSRSRSPVVRRRAESDEDTQDSDQVLVKSVHATFRAKGRGVTKVCKFSPAQRRGRATLRRRERSLSLEPIMAPIVQ